ncbi:hypothetical protein [Fictibacillus phosphorivorans]|uniref:hypothetical protein n=1 Tax=Fictibacillus phosphorivorans TaxID=1221500 RepID=UPI000A462E67|nr:hypothetical protein [Fictibacillus phosphorivorans]
MNKSLANFMMMAAVVTIGVTLILGIAYSALNDKNTHHENMIQTEHQIKIK